jgi:hypothetical protein
MCYILLSIHTDTDRALPAERQIRSHTIVVSSIGHLRNHVCYLPDVALGSNQVDLVSGR